MCLFPVKLKTNIENKKEKSAEVVVQMCQGIDCAYQTQFEVGVESTPTQVVRVESVHFKV